MSLLSDFTDLVLDTDSRLSDARTPTSHTHPWGEVTLKPSTATRWPTFAEVTSKPSTATRWPTFAEVTSKPATYKPTFSGTTFGGTYPLTANINGNLYSHTGITFRGDVKNLTVDGNVTAYSDMRVKTDIKLITDALNKVSSLNGYTFDRIDIETTRQTGVIAQELLSVIPEAVTGGPTNECPDARYSVAYGNLVGLLIEAVKEERTKRESLEDRLNKLEEIIYGIA